MTGRRITAALASTAGALLLSTVSTTGGAANAATAWDDAGYYDGDGGSGTPVLTDPGTLGEAVPGSFVTATFNVLGASHTAGSDPRPSGATRMVTTVQLLQDNAVDLVGLQELENPQKRAFQQLAGTTYRLYYPGTDPRDAIAFRRSRFQLVGTDGVRVPYREHVRTMPVVILRDKQTGKRVIVMSVHNVAGAEDLWVQRRAVSLKRELAKIAALRTEKRLPVIFLGDFNDRRESFYCTMLTSELASASVWWLAEPTCELPRHAGIDWIFGTPAISVTGYVKQDGGPVDLASDHPLVLARVVR